MCNHEDKATSRLLVGFSSVSYISISLRGLLDKAEIFQVDHYGSDAINSVQNGLMLRNDLNSLFDSYILSINPDV